MDNVFNNIEADKRIRIINSALKEFSENDYEKASTNNIVKRANISKGSLYYYFKSKKELYEYLITFVFETIGTALTERIDWDDSDLFTRIKEIIMIKFKFTQIYPSIYDFIGRFYKGKSIEDLKSMAQSYAPDLHSKVYYHNIDFGRFKDNVDTSKAVNIIRWTLEKYTEELYINTDIAINYDDMEKEINEYIEVLRSSFYK